MTKKRTDFPKKGYDLKISLTNSKYPQADFKHALWIKENYPEIWAKGGNDYGNTAFQNWQKYREGERTEGVLAWVKKREAWFARHYENKNIAGVIAWIKWGGYGHLGKAGAKKVVREEIEKLETRKKRRKKASLEQAYSSYPVVDQHSLNEEVAFLYSHYPIPDIRKDILFCKKVYHVLFIGKLQQVDQVTLKARLYKILERNYARYKGYYPENKRLIDFFGNILVKAFSA